MSVVENETDVKMSGWSLVFQSQATEAEYLSQRREPLVRSWRQANMMFGFLTLCSSVYLINAFMQLTDEQGDVYGRTLRHRLFASIAMLVLCIIGATFTSVRSCCDLLSTSTLEAITLLEACVPCIVPFHLDAYYVGRIYALEMEALPVELDNPFFSDTRVLLILVSVLLQANVLTPVRFCKLWPFSCFCVLTYVFALILKSPEGTVNWGMNFCLLFCIGLAISLGKRRSEKHQRQLLLLFLAEKTLRFQSEFQASCIGERASQVKQSSDTLSEKSSHQTVPLSQVIFDLDEQEGPKSLQFQCMQALGKQENWLIAAAHLTIHPAQRLGQGGFGLVLKGEYLGSPVAVKAPVLRDLAAEKIAHELRVNRHLKHPCIVSFHGAYVNVRECRILLVSEFIAGGSLRERLRSRCPLSSKQIYTVLCDICAALKYLHGCEPRLVHCDLKPQNVLIHGESQEGLHAKLCDFGLTKIGGVEFAHAGSFVYMAPEALRGEPAEARTDMFAFGRLVYMVVTRTCPVGVVSKAELTSLAQQGLIPALDWPSGAEGMPFFEPGVVLCEMCVNADIHERASAVEVEQFLLQSRPRPETSPDDDESLLSSLMEALRDEANQSSFGTRRAAL
eukprot:TRINITY_DN13969_c0_g2_i2.p1 TRINITY_DN13969_c0_g2~~TRINITY_DN13969_c0_g2_i2.p1  ORF type:complete len:619 (-),score=57.65 TRINITY_DN13969_c0_g2_i2:30-1886(-)